MRRTDVRNVNPICIRGHFGILKIKIPLYGSSTPRPRPTAPWIGLGVGLAGIAIVLRRPEAIFHAQFWAEDGAVWFADAYNIGAWASLFRTHGGYFQTIARIAGALSQPLPLAWAPFTLALTAIAVQILPVLLILSARHARNCPDFRVRMGLAALYLALPYSAETHAIVTGAQWRMALVGFLILTAHPSPKIAWRIFDLIGIVLCGMSGPFALFLAPIAFLHWRSNRERWTLRILIALLICAAIQFSAIWLSSGHARNTYTLGASPQGLIRILGGQIFVGALVGLRGYGWLARREAPFALYLAATAYGMGVMAYAAYKGPPALRLYILFSALIFASAVSSPLASAEMPQWQALQIPSTGGRYWLHPILAFLCSLAWMAGRDRPKWARAAAIAALCALPAGVAGDWRLPRFEDMRFAEHAARFDSAPPGERIEIPINPRGWQMVLTKK